MNNNTVDCQGGRGDSFFSYSSVPIAVNKHKEFFFPSHSCVSLTNPSILITHGLLRLQENGQDALE